MKQSDEHSPVSLAPSFGPRGGGHTPIDSSGDRGWLAAGDFSAWMAEMSDAIRGKRASDVPCGGCTACCTSSQFIHIGPDETDTLAHIHKRLLFPAPLLPRGHFVLGYDERGRCPMVTDDGCSIYEHRPRTCRTYDCRIFPAAGLSVEEDKALIARRAERWQFSLPSEADRTLHESLKAAATFIREHASLLPADVAPANATQLAVLAVQIHEAFLRRDEETGRTVVVEPDPDTVRDAVMRLSGVRQAPRHRGRNLQGRRPDRR